MRARTATTVTVTAALDGAARPTATDVTVSRTGGTATSGTDYAAVSDFTITIPAASMSAMGTFSFAPTDDTVAEGAETVILTGSATGLGSATAELTITDDDTASTALTLSVNPEAVSEGATATTVTVTAALDGAARPTATDVTVSRTGGTATSGTDYAAVSDFTITIPAALMSAMGTFSFAPTDDTVAEGAETVILTGSATGLGSATAELTITDDDTASTGIELGLDPASVTEGGGAQTITVTAALDGAARPTATDVTVSRTGGTATSGTDYAAVSDFTITIPAASMSAMGTFSFAPTDDTVAEGAETVILTGSATGLEQCHGGR